MVSRNIEKAASRLAEFRASERAGHQRLYCPQRVQLQAEITRALLPAPQVYLLGQLHPVRRFRPGDLRLNKESGKHMQAGSWPAAWRFVDECVYMHVERRTERTAFHSAGRGGHVCLRSAPAGPWGPVNNVQGKEEKVVQAEACMLAG